jgi:hypothetical protein
MKRTLCSIMLTFTFLAAVLLSTGCQKTTAVTPPVPPVSVDARIAQYVSLLAVANQNAVPIVTNLETAGVISASDAARVAAYQAAIAKTTTAISQVLASTGTWATKAIEIQNLALSLVPPSDYATFGAANNVQFQALVTALNAMESTIQIVVEVAQTPVAATTTTTPTAAAAPVRK